MKCQLCKVGEGSIKIAQVVDQKKIEVTLCKSCAQTRGVDSSSSTLPHIFGNFVAELVGTKGLIQTAEEVQVVCTGCGMTWESFQDVGLFGCDICYQTFTRELDHVLKRIHGSCKHIGNRPKSQRAVLDTQELRRLQMELDEAIKSEDFERAAELRDVVRGAQQELERENDGILR